MTKGSPRGGRQGSRVPSPDRAHPVGRSAPAPAVRVLVLVALALATALTFGRALRNDWVYMDDPEYVFQNPHVMKGWNPGDAAWFLTHAHAANWHPLTSWTHQLLVTLFALQPGAHHAASLVLHAATAVLLALVLFGYTGAWWRSVMVAALFALHPLRVESVAWASELKDVLSGFCFVLTLGAYRRWVARPGAWRYAQVVMALALGLLAKPMLVTTPCVLVLLDVWPLRRVGGGARGGATWPGVLLEKWPLFALAAASALVTLLVQRGSGAVAGTALVPLAARASNALVSYGWYVLATLWPHRLAGFYPLPASPQWTLALVALVVLALVTLAALRERRRRPWLVVGWLWFAGMLLPVIGLVQVGGQAHADRYSYLPTLGLLLMLVWGLDELAARTPGARRALAAAGILVLAALALASARQVETWRDSRTMYARALAVTQDNAFAHLGLGEAHLVAHELPQALAELREAERIAPGMAQVQSTLGSALGAEGRYEEAIAHFRLALRTEDSATLHGSMGLALAALGRNAEALPHLQAAVLRNPASAVMRIQLAEVCASLGRTDDAACAAEVAVSLARAAGDEAAAAGYERELRAFVAADSARTRPVTGRP